MKKGFRAMLSVFSGLAVGLLVACGNLVGSATYSPVNPGPDPVPVAVVDSPYVPVADGYHLVWNDEFDVDGLPAVDKWNVTTGQYAYGKWDHYYTDSLANAEVKKGVLNLRALVQTIDGQPYSSAAIYTKTPLSPGSYIEVRAKIPGGQGSWPAIWLCGARWTLDGEIDILEKFPDSTIPAANLHWGTGPTQNTETSPRYSAVNQMDTAFHLYRLLWEPERITVSYDGTDVLSLPRPNPHTIENWPFDTSAESLILNQAVKNPADPGIFPSTMEIDYVRVYRKQP